MPNTQRRLPPGSLGTDAAQALREAGFRARRPLIRASDWGLVRKCPFFYFLRRRLGIVSLTEWSRALSSGSWFHARLQEDPLTVPESPGVHERMNERIRENVIAMRKNLLKHGVIAETASRIEAGETRSALEAMVWYESSLSVRLPRLEGTWRSYFSEDRGWSVLASEISISVPNPVRSSGPRLLIRPDKLLLQRKTGEVWILDMKTTSVSPTERLSTCTWEQQTIHYCWVIRYALERSRVLRMMLKLGEEVRLGGMIHVAVRKPTITFGMMDRPSVTTEKTITSGPRKGTTRKEKTYVGDPDLSLYLERCREWYSATGRYTHESREREADPPVNVSWTPAEVALSPRSVFEYLERLRILSRYAMCVPAPCLFPRGEPSWWNDNTAYRSLYTTEIEAWPEILQREWLVSGSWRDDRADISA